ncbi:MAG: acetyl-CoA carboxylase biotin carboxylase subunit [Chloroflexi bacterium]|nr:acetyl-CoA carboxylase biotin carboxylase subunit [Ardenticatenaceae bacterium]MBL1131177.1 acetyl-CoA carboxylase biotin carboxylase subunit [Chloroflexota bacterium]NOG37276.1 acetyl-CoA carboxylase biotin carboxylase subunit [Chloroflexota bacterium]
MIHSLLIANRGEIACRIIRTCRRLGIRTVAVYADADVNALHVKMADTAVHIGPSPAPDSYLNIPAIIAATQRAGADAVHPGFGFLAENADFARACTAASLIFVGPSPEAIALMGNKRAAKERVTTVGVPIIPGYGGVDQSDERFLAEATRIGFPVLVKAAAGGGGKGMRLVAEAAALPEALAAARREAQQAFGSDELILEKALIHARHVEIQVFGDRHGNLIHLGERECSLQRRHQKVIEEAPSPAVNKELRQRMGATAVRAAQTVHYHNAGTVEFLLDETGDFYFLEMNTRLQVEHPVTELVTGLDLVEWQIRVAEGEALPLTQAQITWRGHAIEARLYAENPANDFLPVTGDVLLWRPPDGDGVRVDGGIQTGNAVSIHYDPMLAKIVAYGDDRATAVRRLTRALETTTLLGFAHNIPFLADVLHHPEVMDGRMHIRFLAEHFANWQPPVGDVALALMAVTVAQFEHEPQPATSQGYWRNNPQQPQIYHYEWDGEVVEARLTPVPRVRRHFHVALSTQPDHMADVLLTDMAGHQLILTVDGWRQRLTAVNKQNIWWVQTEKGVVRLTAVPLLPEPQPAADAGGSLRAPMPGSVLAVLVVVGQEVKGGDALLKLEAMKMEHTIRAAGDGIVEEIYYQPGDTVEADAQLIKIKTLRVSENP